MTAIKSLDTDIAAAIPAAVLTEAGQPVPDIDTVRAKIEAKIGASVTARYEAESDSYVLRRVLLG